MSSNAHVPVLLGPVLNGLNIQQAGVYIDGTFGRGGHSSAILEQLNANGRLIATDRDPQAIASAPQALLDDPRFELIRGDIAELATVVGEQGLMGRVDGLLLDLGVSSPQLDEPQRGFSFLRDGPLDMRMDPESGRSAAEWIADVKEQDLKRVLRKFGEEPHAARIARAIVTARRGEPLATTLQLAEVVAAVVPKGRGKKHPATRTFQAIRIAINQELEQLQTCLRDSIDMLAVGGRLCVISFHSLEDRIVKRFMRDAAREPEQYRGMPSIPEAYRPKLRLVGRAVSASAEEIKANVRARSARLRVAERV
jgi:16S rRNA (cytosine1402-N4)-methyltransferase